MARLAVTVVICKQPDIRTPLRGVFWAKRSRMRRSTGISFAAHSIRSLPRVANEMSFTSPRMDVVINIYSFLGTSIGISLRFIIELLHSGQIASQDQNENIRQVFGNVQQYRSWSGS